MKTLGNLFLVAVAIMLVVGGCGKTSSDNSQNAGQGGNISQTDQPQSGQLAGNPPESRQPAGRPTEMRMTVPDSTQLHVTLAQMIQTNDNQVGDVFTGEVSQSVVEGGETVIPKGTKVSMVITRLVKGGTLKTTPEIAFTIRDITLPDGNTYEVKSSEIFDRGRSHTKREVGMIGGGAAAGAVVGGLLGKGKGAVIGAVTGAAAGTGAAAVTGRQNLVYSAGQTVTFTLRQSLNVVAMQ